jgi:hypothetical protein
MPRGIKLVRPDAKPAGGGLLKGRNIGKARTPDEVLADEIARYRHDPLGYAMFCFPWNTDASIQLIKLAEGVEEHLTDEDRKRQAAYRARFPNCQYGPDLWACDMLTQIGEETRKRGFNPRQPKPVAPLYFATVSGHEIGKSMLVAIIIKWIMDTRPNSKGSVTAVTDEQLRTKTWGELGKWHRMSLTEHWYDYSASRGNMSLVSREKPDHRCDARTCREEKSESFAGQHAPMGTSFYIFDEASGVPNKIYEVREGGLTSGEPMVFDFGNGTRATGQFYEECRGRLKSRYIVREIDSRSVAITNKDKIAQDAKDYGEDSDFFRVRWKGQFPNRGFTQFIPTEDVEAAMRRELTADPHAPLVLGVDVARFGDDDTVIWPRKGRDARTFVPRRLKGYDTTEVVDEVIKYWNFFDGLGVRPAMIFVDAGNTGGAVVDILNRAGYPVIGVMFGTNPIDRATYRYRGDEIWGKMRSWLKDDGGVLPERDSEFGERVHTDLTQREYGFMNGTDRIHLEPKERAKARGVPSPDFGDALAVTFATDIADLPSGVQRMNSGKVEDDWDPFEHLKR